MASVKIMTCSLENVNFGNSIEDIQDLFEIQTITISSMIGTSSLDKEVRLFKIKNEDSKDSLEKEFISIGINRVMNDGVLVLEITNEMPQFLPIFLA